MSIFTTSLTCRWKKKNPKKLNHFGNLFTGISFTTSMRYDFLFCVTWSKSLFWCGNHSPEVTRPPSHLQQAESWSRMTHLQIKTLGSIWGKCDLQPAGCQRWHQSEPLSSPTGHHPYVSIDFWRWTSCWGRRFDRVISSWRGSMLPLL